METFVEMKARHLSEGFDEASIATCLSEMADADLRVKMLQQEKRLMEVRQVLISLGLVTNGQMGRVSPDGLPAHVYNSFAAHVPYSEAKAYCQRTGKKMVNVDKMREIHRLVGDELFDVCRDFLCREEKRLPYRGFHNKMFWHHAIYSNNDMPLANIDNHVGWRDLGRDVEGMFFVE